MNYNSNSVQSSTDQSNRMSDSKSNLVGGHFFDITSNAEYR